MEIPNIDIYASLQCSFECIGEALPPACQQWRTQWQDLVTSSLWSRWEMIRSFRWLKFAYWMLMNTWIEQWRYLSGSSFQDPASGHNERWYAHFAYECLDWTIEISFRIQLKAIVAAPVIHFISQFDRSKIKTQKVYDLAAPAAADGHFCHLKAPHPPTARKWVGEDVVRMGFTSRHSRK